MYGGVRAHLRFSRNDASTVHTLTTSSSSSWLSLFTFPVMSVWARPSMRLPLTIKLNGVVGTWYAFHLRPMWSLSPLPLPRWVHCTDLRRDCGHNHDHDSWLMMTLMCVWLKLFSEMCFAVVFSVCVRYPAMLRYYRLLLLLSLFVFSRFPFYSAFFAVKN